MQILWSDVRYAARTLLKTPAATAAAVLTLAIGIGANATIFSLVDSLFLRSLAVREPSRLVHVFQTRSGRSDSFPISFADYLYYREHAGVFSDLAAHYASAPINFVFGGESKEINGSVVTANYFTLLGIEPSLGRFFRSDEDEVRGRNPVAVIGHDLWERELDRDPQILGRSLRLNGTAFTVVGVAPEGFHGVSLGSLATDVWIPSAMFHVGYRYCDISDRDCCVVSLLGRLAPGRGPADAQEELSVLARQLESAFPLSNKGRGVAVRQARGARGDLPSESGRTSALLAGAVAVVLLIACANVAGLALVRGVGRQSEIALRMALGATRRRLLRQLITESVLLSLVGGAVGLIVMMWLKELLLAYYRVNSEGQRTYFTLDPDWLVLLFTLGLSLVAGVLFGSVPAVRASRVDVVPVLKGAGPAGHCPSRLRDVLVVGQVALSLVLVAAAGLLTRSVVSVYRGPGFDPSPVVLLRLRPSIVAQSAARAKMFQAEVIRRLASLPGVVAVSPAMYPPLPGWDANEVDLSVTDSASSTSTSTALRASYNAVGPRYFDTLGVPLVAGRDFDSRDRIGTPRVAIINETLAHRLWPGAEAVGRSVLIERERYDIVGVVRSAQYRSSTSEIRPFVYANYWQRASIDAQPTDSRTHVRVRGDARAMLSIVRREIAAIDPAVPISEDRPLTEWLDYTFRPVRAMRTMVACFGVMAVFLSAIGLYGVLASSVAQRTREIAIRMALGADRASIVKLVLRDATFLTAVGSAAGLCGALVAGRLLATFLYGVSARDPLIFGVAAMMLIVVGLIASYAPARRATRVDPLVALKST